MSITTISRKQYILIISVVLLPTSIMLEDWSRMISNQKSESILNKAFFEPNVFPFVWVLQFIH